jgi:peptidyl-prolyl cis-trans isomerase A (cyclophilin A)
MKIIARVLTGAVVAFAITAGIEGAQATKATGQTAKKPAAQKPAAKTGTAAPAASKAALRNPARLKEVAPATYKAVFDTSVGEFVVEVHRDWAPNGADRFYNLVKNHFFDDNRFFRVVSGFMVQFGINGDPSIQKNWAGANIPDDPVKQSNKRGYVTFANRGPNTRSTQLFINFVDKNSFLDEKGFAPFGQVISGMDVVDKLYSGYGEAPSQLQQRIQAEGNKFLDASFPKLDSIKTATIAK